VIRDSWGALVGLVVSVVLVGAVVGCYPNPDDLRRSGSTTGTAGKSGGAGSTVSAGAAGGTGRAGSSGPGAAGTGGSGPGTAGGSGTAGTGGSSGPGSAGGTGTGTGGSSGAGILEATFTKWATATCARDQACAPSLFTYAWGDSATCIARRKLGLKAFLGAYADVNVTDASLSGCATQISAQSCTDFANGKSLAMCALPGKRTAGQKCDLADQCATQRCANNATTCGTCAARVALGGACAEGDCVEPLVCGSAGTCVAAKAAGASCATDALSCARSLRCLGGVCAAPLTTAGAACVAADDCDTGRGVICDTDGGKCISWTSSATVCPFTTTSFTACSKNGFCTDADTCLPAAADGKACDEDLGPRCLSPAECSATTGLCTISAAVRCTGGAGATTGALTLEEAMAPPAQGTLPPARFLERGGYAPLLSPRGITRAAGWGWSGSP
jgi:hypothetical protein